MYLMYVDESGDCGHLSAGSPTRYFCLSGVVVHELRWRDTLDQLIAFRRRMKNAFGIRLREEIHASEMLGRRSKELGRLKKHIRLTVCRHFINEVAQLPDISIINIVIDKQDKLSDYDIFKNAWRALIQRFENTLRQRNFQGPSNPDDKGLLFPDHTDDKKLRILMRKLRYHNPVPDQPQFGTGYRNLPLMSIVEDPNFRDSSDSYLVQVSDVAAYFLKQYIQPSKYMLKKGGHLYFKRLLPVLCTVASSSNPLGIVQL